MKLEQKTISILNNFSTVNPSILIRGGDVLTCVSPGKTILGRAIVPNNFPKKFALYSLPQFLSTLSLFDSPTLEFGDEYIQVSEGDKNVQYKYTAENLVTAPPEKYLAMPSVDVEVKLPGKVLASIIKASGVLQLDRVAFVGDGQNIYLQALDKTNQGNTFKTKIGTSDKKFKCIYSVENLIKIMNDDYDIQISKQGISYFKSENVEYWIIVEASSTYES